MIPFPRNIPYDEFFESIDNLCELNKVPKLGPNKFQYIDELISHIEHSPFRAIYCKLYIMGYVLTMSTHANEIRDYQLGAEVFTEAVIQVVKDLK